MRKHNLPYASAMDGMQAFNKYKRAPMQHRTIFMGKFALRPFSLSLFLSISLSLSLCSYPTDIISAPDINMPVMDGLESTRAIRAFEKEHRVPPAIIIVLTGLASASVEQEAIGSGASLFLTKPLRLRQLGSIVEQFQPQ
jgi:CheY-like chemotaxis protein